VEQLGVIGVVGQPIGRSTAQGNVLAPDGGDHPLGAAPRTGNRHERGEPRAPQPCTRGPEGSSCGARLRLHTRGSASSGTTAATPPIGNVTGFLHTRHVTKSGE
jgi:hypothetical protein